VVFEVDVLDVEVDEVVVEVEEDEDVVEELVEVVDELEDVDVEVEEEAEVITTAEVLTANFPISSVSVAGVEEDWLKFIQMLPSNKVPIGTPFK